MSASSHSLRRALSGLPISILLRVARLLVGLGLAAMLNRHLGPGGAGRIMIGLAWVAPLLCLAELGFNRLTVRELAAHPDAEREILGTTFYTRIIAGITLCGAAFGLSFLLEPSVRVLVWVYALLLPTHASSELLLWLESKGRLAEASWAQFRGFALAGVLMIAGVIAKAPPVFFAVTYVVESWSAIAILVWMYHRQGGSMRAWHWSGARSLKMVREAWPEMLAQFVMLMLFRVDTLMLGWMRGDAEAGIYSVAVRLSEVVYFVAPLLGSAFLPRLVELRKNDPAKYETRFSQYLGVNLAFAALCGFGLTFAAPWLVWLLGGKAFAGSAAILMIHAWGVLAYYFGVARTQYLAAEHRLHANLPAVITGLVCNVLLNLWWIPQWSGLGAAWATVVSYTLGWVVITALSPGLRPLLRLQWRGLAGLPALVRESWRERRAFWNPRPAGIS